MCGQPEYVISPGRYDTNRPRMEPVRGMELLWQPSVVEVYLLLLNDASNPETLEAAAGAIQNLAACDWQVRQPSNRFKGVFTQSDTEADQNAFYSIVWRCSYWTRKKTGYLFVF